MRPTNARRNKEVLKYLKGVIPVDVFKVTTGRVPSLLLILDEIGRSDPFCRAMIDICRELKTELLANFVSDYVGVVLVGTGLDRFGTDQNFGTDPKKYRMIKTKKVNLETLREKLMFDVPKPFEGCVNLETSLYRKALLNVLGEPGRASVLAKNARMLRRGLLKTLTSEGLVGQFGPDVPNISDDDPKLMRLTSHMRRLQDYPEVMDYTISNYVSLNGLSDLSEEEREKVINSAFLYHVKEHLKPLENDDELMKLKDDVSHITSSLPEIEEDWLERAFRFGVCTKDIEDTSDAIRYLLCKGQRVVVGPGQGIAFQKLLALHHFRLYEVRGKVPVFYRLRKQQPSRGGVLDSEALKEDFAKMKAENPQATVFIIEQPQEDTAPGPDLIVVELSKPQEGEGRNNIIIFQAKHHAKTTGALKDNILATLFARGADAENARLFEEALEGTISKRFVQHSLTGEEMKTPARRDFSKTYNYNDEENTNQAVVHTLSREAVEPSMSIGLALGGVKEDEELMLEGD
uniref:Uncharacterized protein n=1 Tax=Cyclophora tenuis TaxID=216820 RepID=A0A7S1DDJ0_CYCTE